MLAVLLVAGPVLSTAAFARQLNRRAQRAANATIFVRGYGHIVRRDLPRLGKELAIGLANSDYLMNSLSPRSRYGVRRIAKAGWTSLRDGLFVLGQIRAVARDKARRAATRAERASWTTARVATMCLLAYDRARTAEYWVSQWICGAVTDDCLSVAHDILDVSTLLREQVARDGADDLAAWLRQTDDEGRAYRAAWTAVAEISLLWSLGADLDEGISSLTISEALLAAADDGRMNPQLASMAANQWKSVNLAPSPCSTDTAGQGGPFGTCGLPGEEPQGPGDPSPIDGLATLLAGGAPGGFDPFDPAVTAEAPSWATPGACYGVDPSKLFDFASGDSPDDDSADNTEPNSTDENATTVAQLRKEVEALRKQMEEMKQDMAKEKQQEFKEDVANDIVDVLPLPDAAKVGLKRFFKHVIAGDIQPKLKGSMGATKPSDPGWYSPGNKLRPTPDADAPLESACGQSALSGLLGCMFGGAFGGGDAQSVCTDDLGPFTPSGPGGSLCGCLEGGTTCGFGSLLTTDGDSGLGSTMGGGGTPACYSSPDGDDGCPVSCHVSKIAADAGDYGGPEALPAECAACPGESQQSQDLFDICGLAQLTGVQAPAFCYQVGPGAGGDPY